tara:strand:+ start:2179 stop:4692 length:2514 start_codon:yes stop_codon:yes gene_type:complete
VIDRTANLRAGALIVLVGLLAYGNVPGNAFHYDDSHSILENPHIRSLENIPFFFSDPETFSGLSDVRMYRPLLILSFALNYALGEYDPVGYHFVNILLHLVNGLFLCVLARALGMRREAALIAGILFVAHPVLGEPVNYISSRSSLMATSFVLWAFLLYLQGRPAGWIGLVYGAALLCKSSAIVFPVLLLLAEGTRGRGPVAWRILYIPTLLSVLYVVFTRDIIGKAMLEPVRDYAGHLATQIKALVFYLYKAGVPLHLSVEPQFRVSVSPLEVEVVLALITVLSLVFVLCRAYGVLLLGVGWFLVALLPPSIVPLNVLINEHRLYLPMVGGALFLAQLIGQVKIHPRVGWVGLLIMVLLCAQRNVDWKTEEAIWRDAVKKGPMMARPYVNWSQALLEAGQVEASINASRRALDLQPALAQAHYNLGTAYMHQGTYDLAEAHLRRSVELDAQLFAAHNNLGNLHQDRGDFEGALVHYARALTLQKAPSLFHNMGNAYLQAGQLDSSQHYFRRALELDPFTREAYKGLVRALREEDRLGEAIEVLEEGLRLWQRDETLSLLLAECYSGLGRVEDARAVYRRMGKTIEETRALLAREALRRGNWQRAHDGFVEALKGEVSAELYNDLGAALVGLSRIEEGLKAFRQAARLDPQMAGAFANIGRVYVQHERFVEAVAALQRAVDLEPEDGSLFALLGQAYEKMGLWTEAQQAYQQAVRRRPDRVAYQVNLAFACYELGEMRQAEKYYRAAIAINEESIPALFNLATMLLEQGQETEAMDFFQRVLHLTPDNVDAQINVASIHLERGDRAQALDAFRAASRFDMEPELRRLVEAQMRGLGN